MPETVEQRRERCRRNTAAIRSRRVQLLSDFPCHCCGDPDDSVIQWHHVNEEDKEFNVSDMNVSEDRWWNEVLKCIPVCANCHVKIHKNKLCLINPIGYKHPQDTGNTYVPESTCPQ